MELLLAITPSIQSTSAAFAHGWRTDRYQRLLDEQSRLTLPALTGADGTSAGDPAIEYVNVKYGAEEAEVLTLNVPLKFEFDIPETTICSPTEKLCATAVLRVAVPFTRLAFITENEHRLQLSDAQRPETFSRKSS
jgi:hypothetical protein